VSELQSSILLTLQTSVQNQESHALDRFWSNCRDNGTPLIEDIPNHPDYKQVTFIWRAQNEHKNVCVLLDQLSFNLQQGAMKRMLNTNIWYLTLPILADARLMYGFAFDYPGYEHGSNEWHRYIMDWNFRPDPYNQMGIYDDLSILELPEALPLPSAQNPPEIPTGTNTQYQIDSRTTGKRHRFDIYSPLAIETPANWMLFFDGNAYGEFLPAYLDRLVHHDRMQSHLLIFLHHDGFQQRLQELTFNLDYVAFIVDELLPFVRQHHTLSNNPQHALIGGSSAGGRTALYTAFNHPNIFGKVLSQAGAFEVMPDQIDIGFFGHPLMGKDTNYGWLMRQFALQDQVPLKIHLDVGLYDNDKFPYINKSKLLVNRHMRDVLTAKGYDVHYQEFSGGHDFLGWRTTIEKALIWLTK